jgi:hypothetical protein
VEIEHYTVNHTRYFLDPNSGVHTNAIEGTWNFIKQCVPKADKNKEKITLHC